MDDFSFIQHWICNANTVSNEKLSVKKKKKYMDLTSDGVDNKKVNSTISFHPIPWPKPLMQ